MSLELLKNIIQDEGVACGDPLYCLKEIKEKFTEVVQITSNSYLALKANIPYGHYTEDLNDCWLSFAFFTWTMSSQEEGDRVSCVFHGGGPTGGLNELRHTYWGTKNSDGYVFYLPIDATIKALEYLKKYYKD